MASVCWDHTHQHYNLYKLPMIKLKQSVNNSKELVEYFQEIYKL